jgi:hypothetical protein
MPKGILHITTFITLCKAFLGVKPHFALWRWVFQVVPSFPSNAFLVMGGTTIQVRSHAVSRYLALTRSLGLDGGMIWRENWFYLSNMVSVLPSLLDERSGGVALDAWWLFPLVEEVVEVPALMGAIKVLKAQGLTGPMVVHTFVQRQILLLRERVHPLWQHQGIVDPMMEFPYPILRDLLT